MPAQSRTDPATAADLPHQGSQYLPPAAAAPARRVEQLEAELASVRQTLAEVFEHAAIGMAVVDIDGRFLEVNAALFDLVGYARAELLTLTSQDITHPDDLAADLTLVTELMSGHLCSVQMEKRYLRRDGTPVWAHVTRSLVRGDDGKPLHLIVQVEDISARKQVEAELTAVHRSQQRHAEQLEALNRELARSNADLEQFAYVVSHDLQAPLRTMSGFVELIVAELGDTASSELLEYAGFVVSGARRMSQMIAGLLEFSRIGRSSAKHVPTDLDAVMAHVRQSLDAAIRDAGASVSVDPLPRVVADPQQMERLLQNLVDNALKFTAPGRTPAVQVRGRRTATGVSVTVGDNGIGVDPSQHAHVFDVFARLHAVDAYPGTGIGLAICKKIVERHGGRINMASTPGEGTQVTFTIPDPAASSAEDRGGAG